MPERRPQHLEQVLGEETGGQVELFQEITTKNSQSNNGLRDTQSRAKIITCCGFYVTRVASVYLEGAQDRTELSMKHLSAVMRMLVRRMLLIEARTSAVSRGF